MLVEDKGYKDVGKRDGLLEVRGQLVQMLAAARVTLASCEDRLMRFDGRHGDLMPVEEREALDRAMGEVVRELTGAPQGLRAERERLEQAVTDLEQQHRTIPLHMLAPGDRERMGEAFRAAVERLGEFDNRHPEVAGESRRGVRPMGYRHLSLTMKGYTTCADPQCWCHDGEKPFPPLGIA